MLTPHPSSSIQDSNEAKCIKLFVIREADHIARLNTRQNHKASSKSSHSPHIVHTNCPCALFTARNVDPRI